MHVDADMRFVGADSTVQFTNISILDNKINYAGSVRDGIINFEYEPDFAVGGFKCLPIIKNINIYK